MGLVKKFRRSLYRKPARRLPDFFICGTARGGTTSMWQYLRQHPEISMPQRFEYKEPSFFCNTYGVKDWDFYLSLFPDAVSKKRVGEASGPYLTSPESAGQIKLAIPHAQIIIMLRNPAERAWSKYKWMRENGYEKIATFAQALEAEEKDRFNSPWFLRNHGQYYHNFLYYRSSLYHDQVKRFLDIFGRDKVRILLFEEMKQDPSKAVRQACEFLGVDTSFAPPLKVHNPTSNSTSFDPEIRKTLMERFAPDIKATSQLLGRDLTSIWT